MASAPPPPTILVVDDDEGLLLLMESALKREHWNVATSGSGANALAWLRKNTADLLLLDLKLHDIEGRDLIAALANAGRSLPFIIITGQGDERVAVDMMKRGAINYLVKDVKFIEFVPTVVRRALNQLEKEKRLAAAEQAANRSEAQYRTLFDTLIEGFCTIEVIFDDAGKPVDYRFLELNPAFEKQTGLQNAQGQLMRDLVPDHEAHWFEIYGKVALTGEPTHVENEAKALGRHYEVRAYRIGGPGSRKVAILFNDITQRKRLEREVLEISDREQRRFGRDLHDGLGQRLTAMELFSHTLLDDLKQQAPGLVKSCKELGQELRETIRQVRALSHGLSPVAPEPEGLMHALHKLVESTSALAKVDCRFISQPPALLSDTTAATHLYRIAQEAVNNALKHGKPKRIQISLTDRGDRVELKVDDNGRGFPMPSQAQDGMGLRVMHYRAGLIGATLKFDSAPQKGVQVTCMLRKQV